MNMETIMQILQWLVPSGIAGSLWAWLRHRENSKVIAAKERNDAYKEMYDNLSGTLIELQNENIKLNRAIVNSTVLSVRLPLAAIIMIVLSVSSCRSQGESMRTSHHTDSLQGRSGFALLQQPVPPSVARTAVSDEDIDLDTCGDGLQ